MAARGARRWLLLAGLALNCAAVRSQDLHADESAARALAAHANIDSQAPAASTLGRHRRQALVAQAVRSREHGAASQRPLRPAAAKLAASQARPHDVVGRGTASWYGPRLHGRRTASGEPFDMHGLTAAHRTLPFGTLLDVHDPATGRQVRVRVNDRGPYIRGRVIDLSREAAIALGMVRNGLGTKAVVVTLADTQGGDVGAASRAGGQPAGEAPESWAAPASALVAEDVAADSGALSPSPAP